MSGLTPALKACFGYVLDRTSPVDRRNEWRGVMKLGSAREFEKPPIGRDLSVFPFLGFPTAKIRSRGMNLGAQTAEWHVLLGTSSTVMGRLMEAGG